MNLSDKRVLVFDGGGLFVSLALRLAELKAFAAVDYFREWQDGYCDGRELIVGSGLEEFGVNRVKYFWEVFNEYDLFVFPDCMHGDIQDYLRSVGRRVWGAGSRASLELARWKTKNLIKEIGLPTNECQLVKGMDNLRAYLKEHRNVFVKISMFRGITETFESESYELSKGKLDDLVGRYGPMMDVVEFVVEEKIPDAVEIGYDGYCIDGEFPDNAFYGPEIKNKAYFGKLVDYDELPQPVKDANTKLSYHMEGYRQFWSTEVREKDGAGYVIDITARHASPCGETYIHAYKNLPEILFYGAEGRLVHGKSDWRYAAQIMLTSDFAREHFQPILFPAEARPFVKIYNHCRIHGLDYCVPDKSRAKEVGNVIGLGNTPDEAVKSAKDRADQIKGFDLEAETEALDKAVEKMEEE